jgi:hypothetical protein
MPQGLPVSVRNCAATAWAKAFNAFCPIKNGFQVPPRALLEPRTFSTGAQQQITQRLQKYYSNLLEVGILGKVARFSGKS